MYCTLLTESGIVTVSIESTTDKLSLDPGSSIVNRHAFNYWVPYITTSRPHLIHHHHPKTPDPFSYVFGHAVQ